MEPQKPQGPEPVYLSVCQAARLLGVSPDAVRRRIGRGQLPAARDAVSRRYRILREHVYAQLEVVRGREPPPRVRLRPMDPWCANVLRQAGLGQYVR